MRVVLIVAAATVCAVAYAALVLLLGAVLNLHGEPPRKRTTNERK